eukprot:CAMPEP_0119115158 /NCGR_PEP_ID=MMETSP1180-20130426/49977_1 /TAXON_ID=3052 ORGANISM="Chlamydomonas cf sp, Strain CCMP681" /NCGR_SAMPLE_ID=MMETSP1180 /ASSEMBLY_ACC=CAM_ASM_000741 /LENGTH=307 /DNA_ID=CAMNT_0007104003 /DNA_START=153 /DNA_END=1076 /DNA_ORIENTATION=-
MTCRSHSGHGVASGTRPAVDLSRLLEVATIAAQAGAKVVTTALDGTRDVSYKGVTDLVTATDQAAEAAILEVLRSCFPDHAVLGEEGGVSGDASSAYLWVVDPIDGTTNFVHSYAPFAVSVGVLHHSEPVAGCIIEFVGGKHAWATRTFTANKGGGAFCQGQPISVSNQTLLPRSLLVTGFGYVHDEAWAANVELFKGLTDVAQGVRRSGAASVDLCHVALGVVDGYWEIRIKPWDVAAGAIIAKEAGAVLSSMEGRPYSVFEPTVICAPPGIHAHLLERTRPTMAALRAANIGDLDCKFGPCAADL